MPVMKKLKLSIAAKISRAWPAPTVLLYLTVGSEASAWERAKLNFQFTVAVSPHRYHPFKGCYLLA